MAEHSNYTNYLPPVLWSREHESGQFLARMLRIFEKILTGIPDGLQPDLSLEQKIDQLTQLCDPWRTTVEALPWLAAWVGLSLQPDWSEYQQRRLIAEAASIYQRQGTREVLLRLLTLSTVLQARPRITIDDNIALWRGNVAENGAVALSALAQTSPIIAMRQDTAVLLMAPLLHPSAIVVDRDNSYLIADRGDTTFNAVLKPAIWRVSRTGQIEYRAGSTGIPMPVPLYAGPQLQQPVALVVAGPAESQHCYILDAGSPSEEGRVIAIYRVGLAGGGNTLTPVLSSATRPGWAVYPIAMALTNEGRFVVLDRGVRSDEPAQTRVIIVRESPLEVQTQVLTSIEEPTALHISADDQIVIADAKRQNTRVAADLVQFNPQQGWTPIYLLKDLPAGRQNPLVAPRAVVAERAQTLLICDAGVRSGFVEGDPTYRVMARPPAIYRVELAAPGGPAITPVGGHTTLVEPTGMALDQNGALLVIDRGGLRQAGPARRWRAQPHEFGVTVLFSQEHELTLARRNQVRQAIVDILAAQQPTHVVGWIADS